jgi:hypothetical protein
MWRCVAGCFISSAQAHHLAAGRNVVELGGGSAGQSSRGYGVQGNWVAAACWAFMPTAAKLARTPSYNSMAAGAPVWGVDSSWAAAAAVACLLCWQGYSRVSGMLCAYAAPAAVCYRGQVLLLSRGDLVQATTVGIV